MQKDLPTLVAPALHTLRLIAWQPWRHCVSSLRSTHWLASSMKLAAHCPVSGCWPSCDLCCCCFLSTLPLSWVCRSYLILGYIHLDIVPVCYIILTAHMIHGCRFVRYACQPLSFLLWWMLLCTVWAPGRNVPLIHLLISALYIYIVCLFTWLLPLTSFFSLFIFSLLIYFLTYLLIWE